MTENRYEEKIARKRKDFFLVGSILVIPGLLLYLFLDKIWIVSYVLVLISLEAILQLVVRFIGVPNGVIALEKLPSITKQLADKFINHGYDPELGWIRKANTSKIDCGKLYHIDSNGSRYNSCCNDNSVLISTYGDSYAFCRECEDDETWQYHLSCLTNFNVQNFGVGNYGFDQSLLRLKREYDSNPAKVVVIGVVPSTIARILSVWKHFNEYGNVLAFKPRFFVNEGKLHYLPNYISDPKRYLDIAPFIDEIKQNDYFYVNRFVMESFRFPFLISSILNPSRIGLLILKAIRAISSRYEMITSKLDNWIIFVGKAEGAAQSAALFQNKGATRLFEVLIDDFLEYAKEKNFIPILLFMPMKEDIKFMKKKGHYYDNFVNKIQKKICVVDMTPVMLSKKRIETYFARWHYNTQGNKLVARNLVSFLQERSLINL